MKALAGMVADLRSVEDHHRKMALDRLAFAVELRRFVDEGGYKALGYANRGAYLRDEVRRKLGWSRAKLCRLMMAAKELPEVMSLREKGCPPPSTISLATLHVERRRQAKGAGRVKRREFRKLERAVVNGMTNRALDRALREAA